MEMVISHPLLLTRSQFRSFVPKAAGPEVSFPILSLNEAKPDGKKEQSNISLVSFGRLRRVSLNFGGKTIFS